MNTKGPEGTIGWKKILHHLTGGLSHYLKCFDHPTWCRISAISSSTMKIPSPSWVIGLKAVVGGMDCLKKQQSRSGIRILVRLRSTPCFSNPGCDDIRNNEIQDRWYHATYLKYFKVIFWIRNVSAFHLSIHWYRRIFRVKVRGKESLLVALYMYSTGPIVYSFSI